MKQFLKDCVPGFVGIVFVEVVYFLLTGTKMPPFNIWFFGLKFIGAISGLFAWSEYQARYGKNDL